MAAMLLIAGIGFALQMTAVTPLSASTSSQHLENQLQSSGKGILASAAESGELKRAVLYYNDSTEQFHGADNDGYYTTNLGANEFTRALDRVYGPRNVAYNVYVVFHTAGGETERERMVYQGRPSDHAVSASRTVTLVDNDNLTAPDGTPAATTVADTDEFYAPDAGNGTALYNHVRVEVIAWRI